MNAIENGSVVRIIGPRDEKTFSLSPNMHKIVGRTFVVGDIQAMELGGLPEQPYAIPAGKDQRHLMTVAGVPSRIVFDLGSIELINKPCPFGK